MKDFLDLAGASGAVMGLAAASIVLRMLPGRRELPLPFNAIELTVLVAINIIYGWMTNGTDNAAHLGGLATGAGVGLVLGVLRHAPLLAQGAVQAVVLAAGIATVVTLAHANAEREDLQQLRQQLDSD